MEERIIEIDDREPEHIPEMMIFLCSTPQFDFFRIKANQRLESADFIYRSMGMERKTYFDAFESIKDGRIYEQCYNMSQNFQYAMIIVSGEPDLLIENNLKAVYTNAIDTWFRYNIPTIFVKNDGLLCYTFLQACIKMEQNLQPAMPVRRAKRIKNDLILTVLNAFDMIGKHKARLIIHHYKTLKAVMASNANEMASIDGMGIKVAQKFYELINHEYRR